MRVGLQAAAGLDGAWDGCRVQLSPSAPVTYKYVCLVSKQLSLLVGWPGPQVREYQRRCEDALIDILLKGSPPPVRAWHTCLGVCTRLLLLPDDSLWDCWQAGWPGWGSCWRALPTPQQGAATLAPMEHMVRHAELRSAAATRAARRHSPAAAASRIWRVVVQVRRLICEALGKLYSLGDQLPLYSRVSSLQLFLGTKASAGRGRGGGVVLACGV